jgi:uncharacterized protein
MHILVDADACPKVIKTILFRAAMRTETLTTLVANTRLEKPASDFIKMRRVNAGFDVADDNIIAQARPGDLVITADIPLAYAVIKKGCLALSPRGELFTENNIQERLATRDLMEKLRETGVISGGPGTLTLRDRQAFASHLDRIITQAG